MIRVLLVDDHELMRRALRGLLSADPEIAIVGETGRGEEALELARRLHPDVVLLDIELPGLDGVAVARELCGEGTKVLVVSAYDHEQYVRSLLASGVHGYLLKAEPAAEVLAAVRAVGRGEQALSPRVAQRLVQGTRRSGIAARGTLSEREREVLLLVGQGATSRAIARRLTLKESTVNDHVANAMAKLNAQSRSEAVRLAIEHGIIVPRH